MNATTIKSLGRKYPLRVCILAGCLAALCRCPAPGLAGEASRPDRDIRISRPAPGRQGGQAYQLVYRVAAAPELYWRFKTDFDNDFLVSNKYIREHRFIARQGNQVITENKYAFSPDVYFRWQTTLYADQLRLEFKLLNPEQCHQRFHHGHIQLEADAGGGTRVTQVAYFDFIGARLWAAYPWRGGMKDFLTYTACWEQDAFQQGQAQLPP